MATLEPSMTRSPLVPWVIVLGIVVAGLAGWIAYDLFLVEDAAPSPEVAALVEDFVTSLDEYDSEAANALVMPNFATNVAGPVTGADEAISALESWDHRTSIVGPMVARVDGDWTLVVVPISLHDPDLRPDEGVPIMATVVVFDSDADGHLISAFWVETPTTVSPRLG
ncbi:MAG: hypothetical protein AB1Z57_07780 [Acidimicrobiia bacterium]